MTTQQDEANEVISSKQLVSGEEVVGFVGGGGSFLLGVGAACWEAGVGTVAMMEWPIFLGLEQVECAGYDVGRISLVAGSDLAQGALLGLGVNSDLPGGVERFWIEGHRVPLQGLSCEAR